MNFWLWRHFNIKYSSTFKNTIFDPKVYKTWQNTTNHNYIAYQSQITISEKRKSPVSAQSLISYLSSIVCFHKNFNTIVMCNEKEKYTLWTKMVLNKVIQAYVNEEKVGWITPQRNFTTFYLLKYDVCWFTVIFLCSKMMPCLWINFVLNLEIFWFCGLPGQK